MQTNLQPTIKDFSKRKIAPIKSKFISLEAIAYQLDNFDLKTARLSLTEAIGASLRVTGIIEKIARREDVFRLVIETTVNNRKMTIFANFDCDLEKAKAKDLKIKKGKTISIIGIFQSAGTDAVCLSGCRLSK